MLMCDLKLYHITIFVEKNKQIKKNLVYHILQHQTSKCNMVKISPTSTRFKREDFSKSPCQAGNNCDLYFLDGILVLSK